ncbi:MAG: YhbY family RNA-binding protein [Thiothrix sp.]|nr:YhbY family RNA-binding protein [Thiothrix sp.]HPQ94887.1 YhbY family RNA-binding protein [Thiolinea sp.]
MDLKDTQKKHLKGLGHALRPVVMVGQHGLKDSILEEITIALEHHQLIKIRISVGDRDRRDELLAQILEHSTGATLIQQIGNTALLYRVNPKKPSLLATPA